MARSRGRGGGADERRYPNFEGIGPDLAGTPQAGVEPGARRGNVGTGAFEQPGVTRGATRLEGLRSSAAPTFGTNRGAGVPGAAARTPAVARHGVQGQGTLKNQGQGANKGKRTGRGVRG
jgi:hypothetical protein